MRRLAAAVVAVLAMAGLSGCAADRSAEAARIRTAVTTMPGVSYSDVNYINDFENGANLDISLDMAHATIDQIHTTVDAINDLEGSRFDDHRLTTKMVVADTTEVEYGGDGRHLDADQISADVAAVRRMQVHGPSTSIHWKHFNDYSSLELRDSTDPDGDLRAAIAARPHSSTRHPGVSPHRRMAPPRGRKQRNRPVHGVLPRQLCFGGRPTQSQLRFAEGLGCKDIRRLHSVTPPPPTRS